MEEVDYNISESVYELLPAELHYIVLQHLDFDLWSLSQLRATNKWFNNFLAFENIIDDITKQKNQNNSNLKILASQKEVYFKRLIRNKIIVDASKHSFHEVDQSLRDYVKKADFIEEQKVITELQNGYVQTPIRVAILSQNKTFIEQYSTSGLYVPKYITASQLYTHGIKVSVEFTEWLLNTPLLAPLKGKPDLMAITNSLAQINAATNPEKVQHLLGEFISLYGNYSAAHLAEKLRGQVHVMLHWNFNLDVLEYTIKGRKLKDMIGDLQISSCASCFYSSLVSDVDPEELEKTWPDENSIPKMISAKIQKPLTMTALTWLKEKGLLLKIFDSPAVQSFLVLQSLAAAYGSDEAFQTAELIIEEGFTVIPQQMNCESLQTKMLSLLSDLKITRKIFDLFWAKFPSQAEKLLLCIVTTKTGREVVPSVLLEFAEIMPKEYRSDIYRNKSKTTLWHLIAGTILKDNIHILKVLPKILEVIECDINAVDREGRTALHLIEPNEGSSIIWDLIQMGAKIILDKERYNPRGIAMCENTGMTCVTFTWASIRSLHPDIQHPLIVLDSLPGRITYGSTPDSTTYYLYPGVYEYSFSFTKGGRIRQIKRIIEVLQQEQKEVEIEEEWCDFSQ